MAVELAARHRLTPAVAAPALPALAGVALQIGYPLVDGPARARLSVAVVVLLAAAGVVHAACSRGVPTALRLLAVTAVPGFVVEVVGVHTDLPFGGYSYGHALGPAVLGVPLVVALAWTMLAWPAALAARRLTADPLLRVLVGAWALASADLFLDPQMVAAGYWRWHDPTPHLPGVPGVPLTNLAGWLVVALLMSAALQRVLAAAPGDGTADDRVPVALYLWLYAGWTLALAAFLGLAGAALWGALGMGFVAVPLAVRCRSSRG